jgi:hypothetical protein
LERWPTTRAALTAAYQTNPDLLAARDKPQP